MQMDETNICRYVNIKWALVGRDSTRTPRRKMPVSNNSGKDAKELKIQPSRIRLKHYPNPTYLRLICDRTLSFKEHLKGTTAKVKSRNNLLSKLKGSKWRAAAYTLRTLCILCSRILCSCLVQAIPYTPCGCPA